MNQSDLIFHCTSQYVAGHTSLSLISCIVLIALIFPIVLSRVLSTVPRASMNESNDLWKSLIRGLFSTSGSRVGLSNFVGGQVEPVFALCYGSGWAFGKFQQYLQSLTETERNTARSTVSSAILQSSRDIVGKMVATTWKTRAQHPTLRIVIIDSSFTQSQESLDLS
jgi:hypothetical protein